MVLVILAAGIASVLFLMDRLRAPNAQWLREQRHRQAYYLSEAGIALQLFREKYFGEARKNDSLLKTIPDPLSLDSIRFFLNTKIEKPEVEVNRENAFLEIRSHAVFETESVTVLARFGRALDPEQFGSALTLFSNVPVLPFRPGQIRGSIRSNISFPGMKPIPLPENFTGVTYGDAYVNTKFAALESKLQIVLSAEGVEPGNGDFTSQFPPRFNTRPELGFPLGQVTLRHDGSDFWEIRGPGIIGAQGDIRVRGKIRLVNITLLAHQDLYLEGEAEAENVTFFAQRHLIIQDKSKAEGILIAGGNLFIRDHAEIKGQSMVLRMGGSEQDSTMAIRIVNEAKVSGFVVATGPRGKIVMGGPSNKVSGILMAPEVWLAGSIFGSVVTARLRCGSGDENANCFGDAILDREALPEDFVQPWEFGAIADRTKIRFKRLSWEML